MSKTKSTSTHDYLLVDEITKETVSTLRLDFLYRTHVNVHNAVEKGIVTAELKTAHKVVADEILSRGLLHHSWDKLDSIYQN